MVRGNIFFKLSYTYRQCFPVVRVCTANISQRAGLATHLISFDIKSREYRSNWVERTHNNLFLAIIDFSVTFFMSLLEASLTSKIFFNNMQV